MATIRTFAIAFWDHEGQRVKLMRTFEDTPNISARLCAEDLGYALADKGQCDIREIKSGD